jgi:hypothetical protein
VAKAKRLGPAIKDWLFALVCTGFALTGLLLAVKKGERAGIGVFVFFGSGTAIWIWMFLRRRQLKRHAAAKEIRVRGFVPIRGRRSSALAWLGGVVAVGVAMATTGSSISILLVMMGAGLAIFGIVFSVLLGLGVFPRPFLQFEPAGLRLGQYRYSFLVAWDNLANVLPGTLHGHDLLLIQVREVDRLFATLQPPSTKPECLSRLIRANRRWYDADIAIMTMQYGTDTAVLAHAMKRYATDPESRNELEVHRELPGR